MKLSNQKILSLNLDSDTGELDIVIGELAGDKNDCNENVAQMNSLDYKPTESKKKTLNITVARETFRCDKQKF